MSRVVILALLALLVYRGWDVLGLGVAAWVLAGVVGQMLGVLVLALWKVKKTLDSSGI
jgi:hypothetical protein